MKNLPRWIFASAAKHFKVTADSLSLQYFVEGIDEREGEDMRQNHVELRVTGPTVKEISRDYYHVEAVFNLLFTSLMEMSGQNAYDPIQWTGEFQAVMLEPIPIYKYGSGADDDGSLIGCLNLKENKNDAVRVFHFGQINGTDRVRQSVVDGAFEMFLKGSEVE